MPLPQPPLTATAATIDEARFVDLLADRDGQLRAVALRLLDDPGAVDDILQDACLRALRALPRFRGDASLGTWLHRIVHNLCMDELRRRRRRDENRFEDCSFDCLIADGDDLGAERADLLGGLAALAPEQRAAIVLVDGYGIGYAAAARMLGVPVGTLSSRASRARAVLREALAVRVGSIDA